MKKIKGLWLDKRSGILYLRRKVPLDLRAAFNCGEFYKVSLGTADPREAERKFAVANGEFETKIVGFRSALASGGGGTLVEEEAKALVERYLTARSSTGFASGGMSVEFLLRDLDDAVSDPADRLPTSQDMSPSEWIAYRRQQAGSDSDDEFSPEVLARIEAEHAARNRPAGERWFEYQTRMPRRRWREALVEPVMVLKGKLGLPSGNIPGIDEPLIDALASALLSPEITQQLPLTPSARRRTKNVRLQPEMKLDELLKLWIAARNPRPKSIAAATKAVEDFTSFIGDIGVGEITADDCFEYRDAVATMPAGMPRAHRKLAFSDVYAIYSNRGGVVRVKPPSVKKYLGAIQALLGFAFQERYIASNPGAGIKVEGYTKASNRRPFTKAELTTLFGSPLFTQPWSVLHSRSKVSDMTLRWLFLLGLLTGGRIEELGQILLTDILNEGNVWYIDVTDYVMVDLDETKSLKTDGSTRVLPLHPQLLALGFLDYVDALRKTGATKLFPELKPDTLQTQTKEASRRAGRVIDDVVSVDPRLVFHSFRHTFKDLCRDANIPKDAHDQLTGHAPADVGSGYGLGRAVVKLHQHLRRLKLTFIDWAGIDAARLAKTTID